MCATLIHKSIMGRGNAPAKPIHGIGRRAASRDAPARLRLRRIAETFLESIPPTRPYQIQAEGALGLGVRGAPHVGHEYDGIAYGETGDPGWDPAWRLGAERLRQGGQPLRHRAGSSSTML